MGESGPEAEITHELLERVRNGDRTALDKLCALYREELGRFIGHRLDRRMQRRVDASDVIQEAELEVIRRIDDYLEREPMPFAVWLKRTAYERLLMLRRRHLDAGQRAAGIEMPLPQESSLQLARRLFAGTSSPSRQMGRKELAERVRTAMAQLPEIDREILMMRNLEELPYAEIAGILNIEPAAARKRHGRALLRLSQLLTDGGLTESQL